MQSMTGCGTGRILRNGWEVTVELKTVNHRFLDVSLRLPRNISFLEQTVREEISTVLKRGHADVFISVRNTESSTVQITVDQELARQYSEAGKTLCSELGAQNDLSASKLLSLEGVVTLSEAEIDQKTVREICVDSIRQALTQLLSMRQREGAHLKEDLSLHLDTVAQLRRRVLKRAPGVVADYRDKLESRLKALIADGLDPVRIAQEVALLADRCAIDEELSRLESHIDQMRQYIETEGEIGKKMDFLIQEMNRETNTIGSKAQDAEIARLVVDLKSEIEKMREQIQNVE